MDGIVEVFEALEDPRTGNAKRHSLHELLIIALCTVLCGGETCADMALFGRSKRGFLEEFLTLEHGIPSHDTFSRVFRLLDPDGFHAWFLGFMKRFAETCEGVVAIDGKTLRRSFDRASAGSPLHLVSAWAADQRLVLAQLAVGDKSNEIVAVPRLLALLSLKGRIVTADAMSCQRTIAQRVIEQKADYVLALKANQGTLRDDVCLFLDDPETPLDSATEVRQEPWPHRDPQRQSQHRYRVASGRPRLARPQGRRQGRRQPRDRPPEDHRNPLLSAQQGHPARPLQTTSCAATGASKTNLHWVLDVVFDEDQARNRKDHGPQNLALLRKLALNLAQLEPSQGSMRGKLKRAGWDNAFLTSMLSQFTNVQMR